jgi:spheroidene monooxygenase
VRGPHTLASVPGLRFARILGSGHGGGFGMRPSFEHGGVFALFDDEQAAERFIEESASVRAYREHAQEFLVAMLRASSVRGSWGGVTMAASAWPEPGGPVASLTRASIRPRRALDFWRHAAPAQAALAGAEGCLLLAGLGEAPLLRQATFSLWRNAAAIDAYARQGPHQMAIRAAWQQGYFSESMFVRFVPLLVRGRWLGRSHDHRQPAWAPPPALREAARV